MMRNGGSTQPNRIDETPLETLVRAALTSISGDSSTTMTRPCRKGDSPNGAMEEWMETRNEATDVSSASRWAARTISVVVVTFLAFDGAVKVLKLAPAIEGTVRIGFPERLVRGLGLVE